VSPRLRRRVGRRGDRLLVGSGFKQDMDPPPFRWTSLFLPPFPIFPKTLPNSPFPVFAGTGIPVGHPPSCNLTSPLFDLVEIPPPTPVFPHRSPQALCFFFSFHIPSPPTTTLSSPSWWASKSPSLRGFAAAKSRFCLFIFPPR